MPKSQADQAVLDRTELEESRTPPAAPETEEQEREAAGGNGEGEEERPGFFETHPHAKWVLLFLAIVVIVAGVVLWRYYAGRESTDDAQIDGHIVAISSRVNGTVQKVFVDDNQFVKKSDVLVQLDPADYRVAVARAEADLADARASATAAAQGVPITSTTSTSQLSTTAAGLAAAHQQAEAAAAQVRQAQANFTRMEADLKRYQQLVEREEISRQQYDVAVSNETAARAAVDAARAQLAAAQSRVAEAQAAVESARIAPHQVEMTRARAGAASAQVQSKQAALDQAKLNLEYTTIRAPEDGIVSRKTVEPGQVIQPGQPLMALVSISDLWAVANFKETQLKKMKVGDAATIHVDAYDRDFRGHVDSIGGATGARFSLLPPENATGNYVKVVQRVPVKVVFEPGQDTSMLRPGMSVVPTVKVH